MHIKQKKKRKYQKKSNKSEQKKASFFVNKNADANTGV